MDGYQILMYLHECIDILITNNISESLIKNLENEKVMVQYDIYSHIESYEHLYRNHRFYTRDPPTTLINIHNRLPGG